MIEADSGVVTKIVPDSRKFELFVEGFGINSRHRFHRWTQIT